MDQIRYACYEISIKMEAVKNAMENYPVMANENDMIELPMGLWKEISTLNEEMLKEFKCV